MFEEQIDQLIGLWCGVVGGPVCHGHSVGLAEHPVYRYGVIESCPTGRGIFRTARHQKGPGRHQGVQFMQVMTFSLRTL